MVCVSTQRICKRCRQCRSRRMACSAARTKVVLRIVMSTITVVLLVSSLPSLFVHDDFASRHLHITMSRDDYTLPTRCRHRGGIVDPLGCKACRAIRQLISPSNQILDHSIQNHPKTSQFSVIGRFLGIKSHASESYNHSCTVATSGVNRLASQICHNRLFRKKLQQNILRLVSTEVLYLAAHDSWHCEMIP
jgi:hypothetical protein